MFIPYQVDVPMRRWPIANFTIIGLAIATVFWQVSLSEAQFDELVLDGWRLPGVLAHMWLHGGPFHLIGNMIFLWVFGNAVCAKVGNIVYPFLYLACGLTSAAVHVAFDGGPAIGASGAINGIVGAYLILYPLNNISCLLWVRLRPWLFTVSSY
jgi:membrane associated rhomboid family serine protease